MASNCQIMLQIGHCVLEENESKTSAMIDILQYSKNYPSAEYDKTVSMMSHSPGSVFVSCIAI